MLNVSIGMYLPGSTVIHRLDARTKLLLTLALIVAVFMIRSFWCYAVVALFLAAVIAASRVSPKLIWRSFKPMLFIVGLTFLINLFTAGGEGFKVTAAGVRTAVTMSLRLIYLVLASQIMTLTTSPLALTDGMESLLRPLKAIRFPAHEIAMMMSIALRFIPTLIDESGRIMMAQMSRGADFESGNVFRRAKNMVPLLVPLFVSAFRRADDLAMAMEARCYHGGEGRTRMKQLKMTHLDLWAGLIGLAVLAVVVVDRYVL